MKAVVLKSYGDVDALAVQEMPEPQVGPGQVKVRVSAASINPVDWKIRRGDFKGRMPMQLPTILGRDVAGEVIEVGPGVDAFKPGDRVMGLVQGGYAERVVAPVEAFAKVPESMDLKDAAALPLVALTGTQLMEEAVNPKQGDTVLITGALGAVGRVAVFAAKARGAKVWAGVRARQKAEAEKLGVDGVVALDVADEVAKLPMVDAVADTVGGKTVAGVLEKVKPGGTLGSVVGEPPEAKGRPITVRAIFSHPDSRRLTQLGQSAAKGDLVIPVSKRFPLDQVKEAQKLAEQGGVGKVLLTN
ncbi:NADP-dependent oxidoreductase [Pyxidicoccus parkwayensis]|uniref:NADP-dependent oxidoreductase n=1 Tax=Pyxidicoccus parkwayensis TaxID=2813578 RepID=A0ABX7NQF6_9BACT|nr:NADP-dependent oxidoreductase [Pyxidicoccus parkwaysis]QSQ19810.1 NADP-dependent oxidoreductase [Pyxidicoccus parkwaysis]